MATFTITARQTAVNLDPAGRGHAEFSATAAGAIRGRAIAVPQGAVQAGWLTVAGDAQRLFQPGVAQVFQVDVQAPQGAAGDLRFRLDVVGVENPDEDYGRGPEVRLQPGAAPPPPPARSRGYLTTLIGALAGAVVGGVLGTLPGSLALFNISLKGPPPTSLGEAIGQAFVGGLVEAIIVALLFILGVLLGLWLGPALGAYIALRVRSQTHAGWTGLALALIQLVWLGVVLFAGIEISNLIKKGGANGPILIGIAIVAVVVPPWLARGAVRLIGDHHL